jgi:hypothetical protein
MMADSYSQSYSLAGTGTARAAGAAEQPASNFGAVLATASSSSQPAASAAGPASHPVQLYYIQ